MWGWSCTRVFIIMADIYKFPQEDRAFDKFLDFLKEAYDEGRLTDFVCIYEAKYREGEEVEDYIGTIDKYWFGRSSTGSLGLCQVMIDEILMYIREANG